MFDNMITRQPGRPCAFFLKRRKSDARERAGASVPDNRHQSKHPGAESLGFFVGRKKKSGDSVGTKSQNKEKGIAAF
jgi:hypothetical protein